MARQSRAMRWLHILSHQGAELFVRWLFIGALALAILDCSAAPSKKRGRLLKYDEVAQTWIGVSEDELCLLRLSLNEDGKGFGAYSFLDQEPHVFPIPDWTYKAAKIYVAVEPTDSSHWKIDPLRGSVMGDAMQLTMSGEGWSRSFTLRREEELLRRWNSLREAMDREALP